MPKFTVDTHLFRELGELLVGRDSTALIELIKNSYDADATEVIVHGENLDNPEQGRIVILDNGTGMTRDQFNLGIFAYCVTTQRPGAKTLSVVWAPVHRRQGAGTIGSPQVGETTRGF